ncbi:MAG: tryptophan--tRNA ligase [Candidatus Micrarchaeota archaeon]
MEKFTVTPWEVDGAVDYDKLIKQFGTAKIDEKLKERMKKHSNQLHLFLKRGFYFSHRDLDLVLNDYEQKKGFFLYTGRKPSGPLHLGHLTPMIFTKWLQDVFGVNLYIEITDDEKFVFDRSTDWKQIDNWAKDNILDIAAVGFDPDKTFIFRDSEYIKNTYKIMLEVARKTTLSTAKAVFGFNEQTNLGQIFYPTYQTIPTFFERKRCLIPCAIDQDPYWRIQRDVAESMGYYKTAAIHSKFLPPLQGVSGKMSASKAETAIWLTDDEKTVKNKINKHAFSGGQPTVEEHRKLGGDTSVDVPYQWLSILFEPDDEKLKQIYEDYRSGKLLTGEMKAILIEKINLFLKDHKENRKKAEKNIEKFMYKGKLAEKMWGRDYE